MDDIIKKFNTLNISTNIGINSVPISEDFSFKQEVDGIIAIKPAINIYSKQKMASIVLNTFPDLLKYELYLNTDCNSLQYSIFMALVPDFYTKNTIEKKKLLKQFVQHELSEENIIEYIISSYSNILNVIILTKSKINYMFYNGANTVILYRIKKIYYLVKETGRPNVFSTPSSNKLILKLISGKRFHQGLSVNSGAGACISAGTSIFDNAIHSGNDITNETIPASSLIGKKFKNKYRDIKCKIENAEVIAPAATNITAAPTLIFSSYTDCFDDVSIILDNHKLSDETKMTKLMRLKLDFLRYNCKKRGFDIETKIFRKKDLCYLLLK